MSATEKAMEESIIHSPEEMSALGALFASKAGPGAVFALVGTLGAGKTHWTKGFVTSLGGETEVTSPTFSLVNEYPLPSIRIYHFDFYRLNSAEELLALGWDEYLDEKGITICEWADLFPELLPAHTKWLLIQHRPEGGRTVTEIPAPINSCR